jgi:hypothetical protein
LNPQDIVGTVKGSLLVVEYLSNYKDRHGNYQYIYKVVCDCGAEEKASRNALRSKKSCKECFTKKRGRALAISNKYFWKHGVDKRTVL